MTENNPILSSAKIKAKLELAEISSRTERRRLVNEGLFDPRSIKYVSNFDLLKITLTICFHILKKMMLLINMIQHENDSKLKSKFVMN